MGTDTIRQRRAPVGQGVEGKMRQLGFAVAFIATLSGIATSQAQDYPTRPVTLVLGFAAGGPSDVMARIFQRKLEHVLGQPVVIENRTGAGGNVAAEMVARAAPDGHTLLLANSGILSANLTLYKKINYDPVKDFAPIMLVGAQPNVLVVHPSVPAQTLVELIAYAKANPGKLNFASGGRGSSPHLAGELLKVKAGIDVVHVAYRGTGPALQDVVAGHVQMCFSSVSPVLGYLQNRSLRALGVAALERTALLPDVPTIAELGFAGFEANAWHGLVAPAATPKEVIATVHRAMTATLKDEDTRKALIQLGVDVFGGTPQELADYVKSEIPKWAEIIKVSGTTLD
jgi:tripartite-type tricarboxylate transporter receptor subunit TctC